MGLMKTRVHTKTFAFNFKHTSYIFERNRPELPTCLDGDGEIVGLEVVPEEGQSLDSVQEVTVLNKTTLQTKINVTY